MLHVTADANIYISGLQFGGKPLRFLDAATEGDFRLAASVLILDEVRRVLRTKFRWSEPALSGLEVYLAGLVNFVDPAMTLNVITTDPSDNRVLECAVEARSQFLVTGDADLLTLRKYQDIRILRVAEFLEIAGVPTA